MVRIHGCGETLTHIGQDKSKPNIKRCGHQPRDHPNISRFPRAHDIFQFLRQIVLPLIETFAVLNFHYPLNLIFLKSFKTDPLNC